MGNERDFMIQWNLKFPLDRWYRKKYGIPFMSKQHRESSFLDIRREWEEDQLFAEVEARGRYEPNRGDFLISRQVELTMEERNAMALEYLEKIRQKNNGK